MSPLEIGILKKKTTTLIVRVRAQQYHQLFSALSLRRKKTTASFYRKIEALYSTTDPLLAHPTPTRERHLSYLPNDGHGLASFYRQIEALVNLKVRSRRVAEMHVLEFQVTNQLLQ